MASRRSVYLIGLKGPPANMPPSAVPYTTEQVTEIIDKQTKLIEDAGFDMVVTALDPDAPNETSVAEIKKALESRPAWDAIMIGGGVRGIPVYTPLLEQAVNTVAHYGTKPAKILFPMKPEEVFDAVQRGFPDIKK